MEKIILLASCGIAVVGDSLFVFYAKSKGHSSAFLIVGLILVNISSIIWAYSMRKGIESSIAITFYALFTVAACSSIGVLLFGEHLSRVNTFGIFLAIVALILIGI